jgi:Tfp pilus assembly PilM family ATPase
LPEEKAYLFTTRISAVPPEGLNDAVAFIIEENVPVSLAESVFDFEIISGDEVRDEIKLSVSVLPQNIVKTYISLFESAGITPISFKIESRAIARAIIPRGDNLAYLIINLSLNKTGFYVVEEEVVQFSTTLTYGLREDDSGHSLNSLKMEMSKVLAFWNSSPESHGSPEKKITKIILCGREAAKKELVEKLMSESEILYEVADVWQNVSPGQNLVKELSAEESLDYAAAIGLVLPKGGK